MLESVSGPLEADAEVVHDCDVIVQFLGRGQLGEPASFLAFREVNPAASGQWHISRGSKERRSAERGGETDRECGLRAGNVEVKTSHAGPPPGGLSM